MIVAELISYFWFIPMINNCNYNTFYIKSLEKIAIDRQRIKIYNKKKGENPWET